MKFPLFFDNYHFNGAVVHYGSNNFGHYISIVKKKDVFFLIDDERITQISDEDAQNYISFSYLLLYSK
jgi:ubiquitin C-terminal hydrolase